MGMFLNPSNAGFAASVRSKIYVDKTGLIDFTNSVLGTEQRFLCVSRPRRFGKSMAAKMLIAYYSCGCDSKVLFNTKIIAESPNYESELNHSQVLHIDVQWFRSVAKDKGMIEQVVPYMQSEIIKEFQLQYPEILSDNECSLPEVLLKIHAATEEQFIIIIDEWDCLFREDRENQKMQDEYINFLRGIFKGTHAEASIKLAYITGILPIKKYGTESALNNFDEYTMIDPHPLEDYIGFTENEVKKLCQTYELDFQEMQSWYDGYVFSGNRHIYSPKSVLDAIRKRRFGSHWAATETYESLKHYIGLNEDGLKDSIISMLGGVPCKINTRTFQNDLSSIKSKDDVLTLLVHLGYLSFHFDGQEVRIPNQEVSDEFKNAVEYSGWAGISNALRASEQLLEATLRGNEEAVAKGIDEVHTANTSILSYNNELSLSCVITIAYYVAQKDFTLIREMPSGKGFADIVFLPKSHTDKPALIIELKWDMSAMGAIQQIKEKQYCKALMEYSGNLLLVAINYDKRSKKHECVIERYSM